MRAAYDAIYFELKHLIEEGAYPYRSFLPSESVLVRRFGCAHNTVRKALAALADEGYAQPIHGKGVRVIYQSLRETQNAVAPFEAHEVGSFTETCKRDGVVSSTKVLRMEPLTVDETLASRTHFLEGEQVVHLERVRIYDNRSVSREENYFRADMVEGMTIADAEQSIYHYIEDVRDGKIVSAKRATTVEPISQKDEEQIQLDGATYLAVVRSIVFDGNGLQCEFTETRIHPSIFAMNQVAIRTRISGKPE